jgi:hypothetical protein
LTPVPFSFLQFSTQFALFQVCQRSHHSMDVSSRPLHLGLCTFSCHCFKHYSLISIRLVASNHRCLYSNVIAGSGVLLSLCPHHPALFLLIVLILSVLCIHIYIYIYTYTHIYTHMHTYIYIYIYMMFNCFSLPPKTRFWLLTTILRTEYIVLDEYLLSKKSLLGFIYAHC